jgi:putative transposase
MKGNADRNASLVIGQRLATRYQQKGKPQTPRREEKSSGVALCQDAESVGTQPSTGDARHADTNEHGTAQERGMKMVEPVSEMAHQLRFPLEL